MPFAGCLKEVSAPGLEKSAQHLIDNLNRLEIRLIQMSIQAHGRQLFGDINVGLLHQLHPLISLLIGHRPGGLDPLRLHLNPLRFCGGKEYATFFKALSAGIGNIVGIRADLGTVGGQAR